MLNIEHIYKTYHNKHGDKIALNDVSFVIADRGMTFITGPSGSGKSTLLNIINSDDKDYKGQKDIKGKVIYIKQSAELFFDMTLLDNLSIITKDKKRISDLVKIFKLEDHIGTKVYRLSNGQRKRLEVIKAILLEPDILLCDEVTSALDHENSIIVMEALKTLSKAMAIIIVTHDEDLLSYADHIIKISDGKIIKDEIINKVVIDKTLKKHNHNKDFKDHLYFIYKDFTSKFIHYTLFIITILLAIVSIYSSITLYMTIKEENSYMNSFKYGKNVVESERLSDSDSTGYKELSSIYSYSTTYTNRFDVYDSDLIARFINDHPEVIGVEATFDEGKTFSYIGKNSANEDEIDYFNQVYNGYFQNYFTLKENDSHDTGIRYSFKPVNKPFVYLGDIDKYIAKDSYSDSSSTDDMIDYTVGYKIVESSKLDGIMNPSTNDFQNAYIYNTNNFDLYYIDEGVDLHLSYGSSPKNVDEIVLSNKLANFYAQMIGVDNLDELIGKDFSFHQFATLSTNAVLKSEDEERLLDDFDITTQDLYCPSFTYKISGITSNDIAQRMCAFSIESFDNNKIVDHFKKTHILEGYTINDIKHSRLDDVDQNPFFSACASSGLPADAKTCEVMENNLGKIYYEHISFILEPSADTNAFINELNDYFKPKYDTFTLASDDYDESNILYKNINTFYPFIIISTLIILLVPFIMIIITNKKERREVKLMKLYGYKVSVIYMLRLFVLMIISTPLALLLIYLLCTSINEYAKLYGYSLFMHYDIPLMIFISILVIIVVMIFKRGMAR